MVCCIATIGASPLLVKPALCQGTIDIAGRIADEGARPVVGARVELRPGSRRVVSDEEGQFEFHGVTPGEYTLLVQRIGYQPRTTQVEVTGAGAAPRIVLTAIPQVLDSVRVREKANHMRYADIRVQGSRPAHALAVAPFVGDVSRGSQPVGTRKPLPKLHGFEASVRDPQWRAGHRHAVVVVLC